MIDINEINRLIKTSGTNNTPLQIDALFIEQSKKLQKNIRQENDLHELRSCSKLLVALAVGIAIDKKIIINGAPITLNTEVFPVIKDIIHIKNTPNLKKIKKWTIKDLLIHSTGYAEQMFSERYISDIQPDKLLDFALNYEMPYEVGTRYAYNNVEPFVLACFLQEVLQMKFVDFVNETIFIKLGIKEYKWQHYGQYCAGATGLYLKPSDFFKIGKLLLDGGTYNHQQIVSKNWIQEMCKPQVATPDLYKSERVLPKINGGYFTFISRDDYVFRDGSNGQYLIINPDKKLLIAIMSSEENMKLVLEPFRSFL